MATPKNKPITGSGQIPLIIDRNAPENLQTQIFRGIQKLVVDGRLSSGVILPSFRTLAEQLQVSKNTVIQSYDRLINEGYLITRPGVGTFVSPHLPEQALRISQRKPTRKEKKELMARRHPLLFHGKLHQIFSNQSKPSRINFVVGRPDAATFPIRTWKQILDRKIKYGHAGLTQYNNPAGLLELRQAIACHLGPARGMNVDPEQIIIVGGIQEALSLISRLLVASETRIAIESPCYQGAAFVFKSSRAQIIPTRVDAAGIVVDELPDEPVSLIYVTPSHQYPLGSTLSLERRLKLLEWAWDSGAYIIEDDYDSDFRYQGSPLFSLAGLDRHDSVIYLGTFSKSIGAGIRTGYIVAPPALVEPLTVLKGLLNNGNPWLEQTVLSEFLRSGGFDRHLRKIRKLYLGRQKALIKALRENFGEANVSGTDCGMHLVWTLPEHVIAADALQKRALQQGVGIYPLAAGATFFSEMDELQERKVMLGFPSVAKSAIHEAISILSDIAHGKA